MLRRICDIVDYFAILFIILDCYSVISITGSNGEHVKIIAIILLVASFVLHGAKGVKLRRNVAVFIMLYVALQILFGMLNKPSSILTYFLNQVLIVVLMTLCFSNREFFFKFWEKYRNIMFAICGFSVVFYFLGTVLSIIPPSGFIKATWGEMESYKNWFYLYNESQGTWFFGHAITRNIGIFSEGPMFSYCICFAMWYELFCSKISKFRTAVFLLAIATSFSITGVLFVVGLFFIKYFEYVHKLYGKFTVKRLIVFISLVIISVIGIFLIFDKLDSASGVSRTNQYLNALSMWEESPFIGMGYRMSTAGGFASGILLALVECGLLGCLVYFIPIVGSIIRGISRKQYRYLAFSIGFAGILFLTVVPYKILTLCAASYLWMYIFEVEYKVVEQRGMKA